MNTFRQGTARRMFATVCLGLLMGCPIASLHAWQLKQAALMTTWAAWVDTNNPLPEYPRPQLVRSSWVSLNGLWQFQAGATNEAVPTGQVLSDQILVPTRTAESGSRPRC